MKNQMGATRWKFGSLFARKNDQKVVPIAEFRTEGPPPKSQPKHQNLSQNTKISAKTPESQSQFWDYHFLVRASVHCREELVPGYMLESLKHVRYNSRRKFLDG